MSILVISPKASCESAKRLAEALGAEYCNPNKDHRTNFTRYEGVFNYGCSNPDLKFKNVLNSPQAIAKCVDKVATFKVFKQHGVASPAFCERVADIPKDWYTVVCRATAKGKGNEGMEYWYQGDGAKLTHPGVMFTEYFEHNNEYRVVVFRGKVVARYRKEVIEDKDRPEGVGWHLALMKKKGFEAVDKECVKAALALDIDFVGFDVLENEAGEFVLLEANSGPLLNDEVLEAIVKAFKG